MRIALILFAITTFITTVCSAGEPMLELDVRGYRLKGKPIVWDNQRVYLLSRNGRLWNFTFDEATNYRQAPQDFSSFSVAEMRGQLINEFGKQFEVTSTGHYLVVHPRGNRNQWSERFEGLYRSLQHYFAVRGFQLQEPEFPLVAVVFHRKEDFLRYAAAERAKIQPGTLGYYSPSSNRVLMYDRTAGDNRQDWHINAKTIIHEATHQTAFNVGIHNRFAQQPRWVTEGLGTMFEASGVWNSRQYPRQGDRINRSRLDQFRRSLAQRPRGSLAEFVSSNRQFKTNTSAAYGEAWALTFYLVETQPDKYFRYLTLTATRRAGSNYDSPTRLKDFTSVFGNNLGLFEAHFLRYIERLK